MSVTVRVAGALAIAALASLALWLCAGEKQPVDPPHTPRTESTQGSYCGIHSLFHAIHAVGVTVEFDTLARDCYVGSPQGSSAEELRQAAEDHGVRAVVRDGLTVGTLRLSDGPILLHIRQPGQDAIYNHWIVFLGCSGDQARIIDRTSEVELVPLAEVLALWDGRGILIGRREETIIPEYAAWADVGLILFIGLMYLIAATIITGSATPASGTGRIRRTAAQVFGLVLLASGLGITWHGVRSEGYFGNRTAIGLVAEHRLQLEIPIFSVEDVVALQDRDDVVIVDARLAADFRAGHIPGALSIPITAGWRERRELLGRMAPSHKTVVVYCQSEGCRWADAIAGALMTQGHPHVAIYRGGYQEWVRDGRVTRSE